MDEPRKSNRKIPTWLILGFAALISVAVAIASVFSLFESDVWTTDIEVGLVLIAVAGFDIIIWRSIKFDREPNFDPIHPKWHFISALTAFVMTTASAIYFGFSYFHVTPTVNSDALATLAIAGMTVPAGATLILATAALPKKLAKVPDVSERINREGRSTTAGTQ